MTAATSRPPTYLQTRLKAVATSSTSSLPTSKSPISHPNTAIHSRSNTRHNLATDPLSDTATAFLIRRTLCPQTADKSAPILELLPPLTSSNDVDLQLYAFIAIVIREFVYTWYAKITPDQGFVEEVVKIIAHCTRGLEQRLRKVDLESLVFDELAELLDAHVRAYRAAYYTTHPPPLEADPRLIYHSLWPTPALFPVPQKNDPASVLIQKENEQAYRQLLVQGVLSVLLPTEDLENDSLTSLIGQIFSEMILGNGIGGKACEPWVLWEGITKMAEVIKAQLPKSKAQERIDKSLREGTKSDMLTDSAMQRTLRRRWSPRKTFWIVLQYLFVAFTTVRFIIVTIATSSSLPSRLHPSSKLNKTAPVVEQLQPPTSQATAESYSGPRGLPVKQPLLGMKIWSCVSTLLDVDVRMPWSSAALSILQWFAVHGPGEVGATDGMIDKLLSHLISTHILLPARLPLVLRTARAALFPGNAPAPPRAAPSAAEALAIRRQCAAAILDLIPAGVQRVYFGRVRVPLPSSASGAGGDDDDQRSDEQTSSGLGMEDDKARAKRARRAREAGRRMAEVEEALDCFGDAYANKHLMYGVVELLLVRLMPELGEKGVGELRAERLS